MLKNLRSILRYKSFVLTVATTCFLNCALATEIARSQDLNKRISIDVEKKTLKETLDQVSKQAHVGIIYSNARGVLKNPVTIHAKDQPVSKVLNDLLSPLTLTYEIIGDQIVVKFDNISSRPPSQGQPVKQSIPIKGKVTDDKGSPLPGATIKIKDGPALATTDSNGEFEISNVSDSTVLQISFVGYLTKEIVVTNANYLTISLKNGSNQLNEVSVVSTGYQNIPKERATGSFSQPIKTEFEARVATDVLSKLNGITSGLLFNANTTAARNGIDINIRGRSTIFANDQPLVVVDNFPYSGDINNINPNDVESVTVLKDAASASIWGVRAGNGVIVITTKKGKLNQSLKIGFNANITVFDKPDLNYNPNQLGASSFIGLEQFLFGKGYYDSNLTNTSTYPVISPAVELLAANRAGSLSSNDLASQLNTLRGINVNDQLSNYFYRKATNQQYALTLSGGSDKATYYLSTGYDNNLPGLKGNTNQRITINSLNTFYLVKNLELSAGLNIVQDYNKIDNTLSQFNTRVFPYSQIADASGNPLAIPFNYSRNYVQSAPANGFLDWSYYPLKELGATNHSTKDLDIRLTTGLKYAFIPGLTGEIKYQYERSNSQDRDYQSQQTYFTRNYINQFSILNNGQVTGYNVPLGGILSLANANMVTNNVRGQLNFNRTWGNNNVSAIAGYELSQTTVESNGSNLYGYNDDLATFINVDPTTSFPINPSGSTSINSGLGIGGTLSRIRSSFANAAYTYMDRYTLSGSARIDGTNYFGVATNQKNIPLWSAGAKWNIAKENFYTLDWLPVLALRASYGYNGNLDQSITGVTTFRYSNLATYLTNLNYAAISNIGNPDLRWEKTGITNLALGFGTKNNVLTGSLEYYFKKETDLLGYKTFPENSGITTLEGNYSDMTGKGFDLSLTSQNLKGSIKWTTTLLFSHATDKVTRYDVNPLTSTVVSSGSGIAVPVVGKSVFGIYSYKWDGLNGQTGNPVGFVNGTASENYATITTKTPISDLVYAGPARPTYFGGFNNRLSYKGFSLAVQINYKFGYYFRSPTINYYQITSSGSFLRVNRDFDNRWLKPGDEKNTNVPSLIYPSTQARDNFYQFSEATVEKGDHVRLQDISLSYDLNKSMFHRLPFNNIQLFIYANNIGVIWRANHKGLDPDAVPASGDINTMPNPRSISFGLKGSF
ncbi:TonB-linked SusC/RagA family outer membrane protein [Mucilaginibacter gracilis]|uniref:TonB-linked SusC/RagA family outer membrane protein n=1 Tax=Mucilaginibacter gracilis TaxID=423350 RepID=A0A495J1M5_9SPHI|nr:SusC/RagA family TonB-linked outer membrane protein [Mucilaginibacter gracilis]RKR82865.1 TonB-linked SusC/RagA family outer membrane protein [Mucilaginibacter gracilis]